MRMLPLVLGVSISIMAGAAQAAVVYNENFENGVDGTNTLPNWTLIGSTLILNSADYRNNAGATGDTGTGQFLAFGAGDQPDNGIATTLVGLTSGQSYVLSFDFGSFGPAGSTQSIQVSAGTGSGLFSTLSSTTNLANLFMTQTLSFVANSSSVSLTFIDKSLASANVDALIDNVRVSTVSAAVPELSTWAMMGIGFLGLGLAGRKRLRRAELA